MLFSINNTVQRALQADGYVPATMDCLWEGDEFIWEGSYTDGRRLLYLMVINLQAVDGTYTGEDGREYENVILKIIATDQDGIYHHLSLSYHNDTWIRQHPLNKANLFDLKKIYEDKKASFSI